MRTKECTKCNTEKALTEFHKNKNHKDGRVYDCKPCAKMRTTKWNYENPEKIKAHNDNNSQAIKDWTTVKLRKDPKFRLAHNLRVRTGIALRPYNEGTSGMWENLSHSREDLCNHLESLFTPEMTWDNYGTAWELDHIMPMCSATNADEVNALNIITNLQPLSPSDNSKKIASDLKKAK